VKWAKPKENLSRAFDDLTAGIATLQFNRSPTIGGFPSPMDGA
jgi:hypothetical protein